MGHWFPAKEPGAGIHDGDIVAEKIVKMVKEGRVVCIDGTETDTRPRIPSVGNGDNPAAPSLAQKIRAKNTAASGIEISALETFLEKCHYTTLQKFRMMGD